LKAAFINRKTFLLLTAAFLILCQGEFAHAEPTPFNPDDAVTILRRIIEKKAIPFTVKRNDAEICINEIKTMSMDWNTSRIDFSCAFSIRTTGYIPVFKTGELSVSAEALFSEKENGIGIRLIGIERIMLDDIPESLSKYALSLINKSLKGKEYWNGENPESSEVLTKQNFSGMMRIILTKKLPFTFNTKKSIITLYHLYKFDAYRPGKISAVFYMKGTRKGIIDIDYSGVASIDLSLFIDPETLEGYLKIGEISYLKFDDRNAIMQNILSMFTRSNLEGKRINFNLNKKQETFRFKQFQ
jgi:hypothetical protein